ncbi:MULTISPECIES: non-heme iron oxygenase ferredoxin subunit [Dermacoccus]|uniref:Ferredoxin n=1 Tax=Dermacoccus nishinomiyaensis TaxID=1274 RepID=A0A075JGC1_9MICO|nr:non-heme iron oxygenase ferredoxin subunit [Dermacoccus nishinomiyaensis]AIF40845.1 ferredoxin [Dermacoccus nishinomiyaensis]MCG7428398.1 non-heme iron oxygenase ferredoxin subunit [Dermacoccus nishinomiyaensis]MCI0152670.1 non-heme iron oxygenase ferredoxin subunit [Dermacoccus nishinomiyaensis]NHC30580.1 non-heme iron oxygenase ferredoxin subunit [Dermacoccus nishinomiyaensis]
MSENVEWVNLASVEEIPQPGAIKVDVDDLIICLAKDSNGVIHALDDTCTHAAVSLSEGEVDDDGIECWLHGSKFNYETGKPMSLPAMQPVNVYPTKIDGSAVFVGIPA